MKTETKDFLLEIDTQELPVGCIRPMLEQLKRDLLESFETLRAFDYEEVYVAGMATKLICYIKGMPLKEMDTEENIVGPPESVAFDKEGKPTKQGMGFAKSKGVNIEDLRVEFINKNRYVIAKKKTKGRKTEELIRDVIPNVIRNARFPKTMRWDSSGIRFARPIESMLVLFGKDNIRIELGGVPQKKIDSVTPSGYLKKIKKVSLIDQDERKKKIKALISKELKRAGADILIDDDLLEEVNFMVSSPMAFSGGFDKKFLSLPEDVLKASMAKHQRIFTVTKKGRLINRFVAVIDGKGKDLRIIRKNYENILEAKLKDSLFFLDEDMKKPLSEKVPQLKDLIFQKDLGNMFEKIERLKYLSSFICDKLKADGSLKECVERASELSKVDLVTHMVGEFPSLQGVMGGEYALRNGEKKDVAAAIKEHYLPKGSDDELPKTAAGSILAISDKLDNLVGFLGMGVEISGSFDPFGIRRNTQGLIQIIKNSSFKLNMDELVQRAIELYKGRHEISSGSLKARVIDYIKERLEWFIFFTRESGQIGLDKAILDVRPDDVLGVFKRAEELSSISNETYFLQAAKVVERTSNILKAAKGEEIGEVDERLLKEGPEKAVWQAYLDSKDKIQVLIDKEEYKKATREYALAFFEVLHEFFDKVLVNVDDKALRLNRLSMMKTINRIYAENIANLALLQQIVVK